MINLRPNAGLAWSESAQMSKIELQMQVNYSGDQQCWRALTGRLQRLANHLDPDTNTTLNKYKWLSPPFC